MIAMFLSMWAATAWCLGKHAMEFMNIKHKADIWCADAEALGTPGFCFQMDAEAHMLPYGFAVMTHANCAYLQQERNPPDHMWS